MMNFSQALKGQLSTPAAIMAIQSQAETELGRYLSKEEESILFSNTSPNILLGQMQKYGYGFLKFQLFLKGRPGASCQVSPSPIPRDGNCLIHAISDSILNNDALKHNGNDQLNETWSNLLHDLKFFEDIDDHTMFLRSKWVMGAAEWMSGGNGSKQNDKEIFAYSDKEWNYIWSTMMEDGAWAVPSVKDDFGHTLKENHAPEMLIKYIAHDLKIHIVIFDLVLGQAQFCSANHVKDDNALFDSPILLYCTGGHFQSVFPENHEYFINYARELEERNNHTSTSTKQEDKSSFTPQRLMSKPPNRTHNEPEQKKTSFKQQGTSSTTFPKPDGKFQSVSPSTKRSAQGKPKKAKYSKTEEEIIKISNKYQCLSSEDTADSEGESSSLRKGNTNDKFKTLVDKREYERERKKAYRAAKSEADKARCRAEDTANRKIAREI